LLELVVFITLGVSAAALALKSAIPGREPGRQELALISGVAISAIILISCEPSVRAASLATFMRAGIQCTMFTATVAALPWLALFWAVRRGVPLATSSSGALIGVAAFSFALAIGRLCCPIEDSVHFLIWHMLPGAVGLLISISAASAWLRRRSTAAGP